MITFFKINQCKGSKLFNTDSGKYQFYDIFYIIMSVICYIINFVFWKEIFSRLKFSVYIPAFIK